MRQSITSGNKGLVSWGQKALIWWMCRSVCRGGHQWLLSSSQGKKLNFQLQGILRRLSISTFHILLKDTEKNVLPLTVGCGGLFKWDLMFLYVDLTELIYLAHLYLITLKESVADAHFSLSNPQTLIGKCIARRYFWKPYNIIWKTWSTVLDSVFDINCQATAG